MEKTYPDFYKQLNKLAGRLGAELKGPLTGFTQVHAAALADGALSRKTKELMALGISVVAGCRGCLAFHVHDALRAGATRAEIIETVGVAIFMGGGPALVYGCEALEALEQFETEAPG
jgi:AhpD family alkylhydroperoxidase